MQLLEEIPRESDGEDSMVAPYDAEDIRGLPGSVRSGLIAITFFGCLSLVSATSLFFYISYWLLKWRFCKPQQERRRPLSALEVHCSSRATQADIPDYTMGLPQLNPPSAVIHYDGPRSRLRSSSPCPSFSDYHNQYQQFHDSGAASTRGGDRDNGKSKKMQHKTSRHKRNIFSSPTASSPSTEVTANPFLLLIYNLLLSDMIQAASFLLSASWLRYDATYSGSVTCWMQGWLAMTGKLSASACLVFASGLTYLTVVRGYSASPRALLASIGVVWLFTHVLAGTGVAITHNGRGGGGWFNWSNGWCWVNSNYRELRFWLGYFWIFLSVGVTILIYGAIFTTMLRQKKLSWRHMPDLEEGDEQPTRLDRGRKAPPRPSGYHPAFLVYPFIYLVVTGPLATGRMLTMAGYDVSMSYYLFAGALSASHGFLNATLWSMCILFMDRREQEELGLDRFMRTPKERTYGNMVWIQGGTGPAVGAVSSGGDDSGEVWRGLWAQQLAGRGGGDDGQTIWRSQHSANARPWPDSSSQHSLNRQTTGSSERGNDETMEMHIFTTVTIEALENGVGRSESLES
ncbi:G protein-coupled glucose receptor regulating Gpa2-domain-containing protein [Apiospora arundinis]|uniref:G protein-coupled glucose receptor regulating Gpa2-domain-containing protein n=1 Tax=Apiospora arundinis TaxID=335852 RepID=A0ABR2IWT4_9PEZI